MINNGELNLKDSEELKLTEVSDMSLVLKSEVNTLKIQVEDKVSLVFNVRSDQFNIQNKIFNTLIKIISKI